MCKVYCECNYCIHWAFGMCCADNIILDESGKCCTFDDADLEEDERLPILRVTIEKINLGTAFQRKYRVQYGPHLFKCYNIPTERILKFIKENKRELSKVSYIFTDRSDEE